MIKYFKNKIIYVETEFNGINYRAYDRTNILEIGPARLLKSKILNWDEMQGVLFTQLPLEIKC